jgi:hypothetical protein
MDGEWEAVRPNEQGDDKAARLPKVRRSRLVIGLKKLRGERMKVAVTRAHSPFAGGLLVAAHQSPSS